MHIRQIIARREQIRTELTSILDAHPDGLPEGEVRARADALEGEAERLNDQERRQALVDDLDRRASGVPIGGTGNGDSNFDRLVGEVTLLDTVRAQLGGTDAASGRAREVSAELERRSGAGGGTAANFPADASGMPHLGPSPGHVGTGPEHVGTNQNQGRSRMNGHAYE